MAVAHLTLPVGLSTISRIQWWGVRGWDGGEPENFIVRISLDEQYVARKAEGREKLETRSLSLGSLLDSLWIPWIPGSHRIPLDSPLDSPCFCRRAMSTGDAMDTPQESANVVEVEFAFEQHGHAVDHQP